MLDALSHSLSLIPRILLLAQIQEKQEPWGTWDWEIMDCLIVTRSALICSLASLPLSAEGDRRVVALQFRPRGKKLGNG